jgi:hypothetical protein
MRRKKYDVIYEHTNSGVPGGTEIIATFNDKNEAQAVALALNEHHGYEAAEFEGGQDIEGYYVRMHLIGQKVIDIAEKYHEDERSDRWFTCEVCGCATTNWCCLEGGDF